MKRRTFIKSSSLTALGVSAFGIMDGYSKGLVFDNNFRVNERRIASRIVELSKFGMDDKGHGYRVAYTKGDIAGRAWFIELMKNAGLEVSIDSGGNIIGKRKGKTLYSSQLPLVHTLTWFLMVETTMVLWAQLVPWK